MFLWHGPLAGVRHRIPDKPTLAAEVTAWAVARNRTAITTDWRFTTTNARVKLKRLYPSIDV